MGQSRSLSSAALITLLAGVMAAAIGSASTLAVNGGSLQAGNDNSLVCDSGGASVGYTVAYVSGDFRITHATVTGWHADCIGKLVDVVLTQGGVPIAFADGVVQFLGTGNNRSTGPLAVSPQPLASSVDDVHVLVMSDPGP